ncbi:DUF2000 domain-containing protein [uncultured Dysosmobacter sp.]|uniref:DUF2000 domain-containing protein n=1 Tax=uncultured Dysosmobacter sp. TaxID=2591384 RepID=UPI002639EF64|nr:DUF2000 domain-containing protein [uncultured Dysosmobacter sp.]
MDVQSEKCVMILDEALPLGLVANTAAILGITLGKHLPEAVGADVRDGSGHSHLGIIAFPVPILRGSAAQIKALRERLYDPVYAGLTVADFSDFAQVCKTYDEFTGGLRAVPESDLRYLGLAICGGKKQVNKLTGSLPLLR